MDVNRQYRPKSSQSLLQIFTPGPDVQEEFKFKVTKRQCSMHQGIQMQQDWPENYSPPRALS